MHKALRPRDGVDRLYVSKKKKKKKRTKKDKEDFPSIEDSVDASIQRPGDNTEKCGKELITVTRNNTYNWSISGTKIT